MAGSVIYLCPGQGAQTVAMGKAWADASPAARAVFDEADALLSDMLGTPLSQLCFQGPADRLNATDVSQPAIYTCSVACYRGLLEQDHDLAEASIADTAGLSLGEYTALHLAEVFDFATGLQLVATRGQLMQQAAKDSRGGMVALMGTEEAQAEEICEKAADGGVLVCANFNAPGQIVLSGDADACERAAETGKEMGLRATPLTVAGAFHSPHMQPAADRMAETLAEVAFKPPKVPVWSNVTASPHVSDDTEQIKRRLVEQIVSPVRWAQTCGQLAGRSEAGYHELAPGTVLRGLMKRTDRKTKVTSHDTP